MRHLFVTNDFPPKLGGIESYLTSLCKGFDPADIAVVAPARPGYEAVDDELPYDVFRLPGSYLRASQRTYRGIIAVAQHSEPDVVHFLSALPLGRLGSRMRDELGIPFTVFAHGSGEILLPARVPFARRALRVVLTSADLVLPVSEFTAGAVVKITKDESRVAVVPPSIDIDRFGLDVGGGSVRAAHDLRDRFVVLFVSRLVKRKGCDVLIRAIASQPESRSRPDVSALIVGGGPEARALRKLAHELDVDDRVIFAGMVPSDDLPAYYAAANVFCMPCTNRYGGLDTEGFGIVYLEAQASGLPCIAGRCGGSIEAVEDGVTGIVLDESTPRAVALALMELRRDETLCARLGGAGRARMEREFAPFVIAERLEEALEAID